MAPHPGMDVCCPLCEGPIPDLLGELTDEPAAVSTGQRATDCYYCGAPLVFAGNGAVLVGQAVPPPARRTARKRDLKFDDAAGLAAWIQGVEQALQDEANNPQRDPRFPPITRTRMVNKLGRQAFEGYSWI